MKKLLVLMLALSLSFTLAACGGTTDPTDDNGGEERTAPVIEGADDVTIYMDETFDPMEGITATNHEGEDITGDVTVTGTVDTSETGSYYLRYSVEDSEGLSTEATRYVTVEIDPANLSDDMVQNGDFSLGKNLWNTTMGLEGGNATFTVVDGELKVDIESVSGALWEPRLSNRGINFEKDQAYEVTFDARAEEPRSIHVQVGEILDASPWFTNFKPGHTTIFDLTTTMETYTFEFYMGLDSNDNGALIFEMGTVTGNIGTDNLLTTVYYDNVAIEPIDDFNDTTDPVITGANDATIELGTAFDPLEGVEVSDNVDGEITLDASHVAGSVDTETEDVYTLTYTFSDAAGNEVVHTREITVVGLVFNDTEQITGGAFDVALDSENPAWTLYEADWGADSPMSDGSMSVVDGKLQLEVNDIGSWGYDGWLLQAINNVTYQEGYTYKAVFKASADAARDISVAAGFSDADNNWHGHSKVINVTDTETTYEFIFTIEEDSGEFDDTLKFEFGQSSETVYIDDVELLILDREPLQDNGTFEETGWYVWAQDWDAAPQITEGIVDGEYVITSSDSLGQANWAIQFVQEGLTLENGQSYRVNFDASADHVRDINFKVIDTNAYEVVGTKTLSTTMDSYTFDFTYDGTATAGKISIELGAIGDAVPGTTTFDNISIVKLDDTDTVIDGSDLVTNGTFDEVVHWGTWSQDWDPMPVTSMEVVNGELVYTYDGLGDANWAIQLFQNDRDFEIGQTYTLEFDMKADHARDINAKIISGDYEIVNTPSLTTDMTHYEYTFVYDGPDTLANINFEFGAIGTANTTGVITVDNVLLYRNLNPQE